MSLKSFFHDYFWQIMACTLAGLLLFQTISFNQSVIERVNMFNNATCYNIYVEMYENPNKKSIVDSGDITWENP